MLTRCVFLLLIMSGQTGFSSPGEADPPREESLLRMIIGLDEPESPSSESVDLELVKDLVRRGLLTDHPAKWWIRVEEDV